MTTAKIHTALLRLGWSLTSRGWVNLSHPGIRIEVTARRMKFWLRRRSNAQSRLGNPRSGRGCWVVAASEAYPNAKGFSKWVRGVVGVVEGFKHITNPTLWDGEKGRSHQSKTHRVGGGKVRGMPGRRAVGW